MDISSVKDIVLVLFIMMIIALNVWLFSTFKKNKSDSSLQIFKKSAETLRNPFKQENQQIDELSSLVKNLSKEIPNQFDNQNEEIL